MHIPPEITSIIAIISCIIALSTFIGGFLSLDKIQNNHLHHVDLDLKEIKSGLKELSEKHDEFSKEINNKLENYGKAIVAQKTKCDERTCSRNKNLKTR